MRSVSTILKRHMRAALTAAACAAFCSASYAILPAPVYDIERAREICDSLPLQGPEGIWIYPDDKVAVIVRRIDDNSLTSMTEYDLTVVESETVALRPGERIGRLRESAEAGKYEIELYTERRNAVLMKPKSCMAEISKDGEALILRREKPKFNLRFTLNPSVLLPKFWRMLRVGASANPTGDNGAASPKVGMLRIYPSYDGNGSSRRTVRYL